MVDKTVTQENSANAIQPSDLFRGLQSGLTVKYSFQQVRDFIESFSDEVMTASGDILNGAASLVIAIPAGYDSVSIELVNCRMSATTQLVGVISVNGGSVFLAAGYAWGGTKNTSAASAYVNGGEADTQFYLTTGVTTGASGASAQVRFPNPNSATVHKRVHCRSLYKDSGTALNATFDAFGSVETVSPITHVKFMPNGGGTFISGTYLVRAGKKS